MLTVTNVNSLSLLNILGRTSDAQSDTLTRLSTGYRVNKGSDDPAALQTIRQLETSLTSTDAAIQNNQRTDSILKVADSAFGEVNKLLTQINSLVQKSSNGSAISAGERAANQAQIDSAIASIDRIIGTTQFNGTKLLDGSIAIDTNGVSSSNIRDVEVYSRNTANGAATLNVSLAASANAQLASASIASGASFSLNGAAKVQLTATNGTVVIDLASSATLSQIRDKINEYKAQTGASASISGNRLTVNSADYGSRQFVRVNLLSGTSSGLAASAEDAGRDASVLINGQQASVDGLQVNYNANGLSLKFNITTTFNSAGGSTSFSVSTDGGATFQLGTDPATRATIGVDGLFSQRLGSSTLGYLDSLKSGNANDLTRNPGQAAQIVGEAQRQLASVQGRLGGFQKFQVGTALAQQNASKESLTSALSTIRDVDFAAETAELNRQNVLLQSAISLLGVANQQSSQILSLLR